MNISSIKCLNGKKVWMVNYECCDYLLEIFTFELKTSSCAISTEEFVQTRTETVKHSQWVGVECIVQSQIVQRIVRIHVLAALGV